MGLYMGLWWRMVARSALREVTAVTLSTSTLSGRVKKLEALRRQKGGRLIWAFAILVGVKPVRKGILLTRQTPYFELLRACGTCPSRPVDV